MGYTLLEFIKKTGVFLICAESIIHFIPGSSYQKYVKVLVGIMILAQLLIPIKALLTGQEKAEIEQQISEFRNMVELQSSEIQSQTLTWSSNETIASDKTKMEIKSKLDPIVTKYNYSIDDIILNEIIYIIISNKKTDVIDTQDKINIPEIRLTDPTGQEKEEDTEIQQLKTLFCEELGTGKAYLEVIKSE